MRPWMVLGALLICAGELGSESLTLTTYYPAPSGIYAQMITTGKTQLARDGESVNIGRGAAPTPAEAGRLRVSSANNPPSNGLVELYNDDAGWGGTIALENNAGDTRVSLLMNGGNGLSLTNARFVNSIGTNEVMSLSPNGSVRLFQGPTDCGGAVDFNNSVVCDAAHYATFTPGLYVEGTTYANRGGSSISDGVNTADLVWARTSLGVTFWGAPQDITTSKGYCCSR